MWIPTSVGRASSGEPREYVVSEVVDAYCCADQEAGRPSCTSLLFVSWADRGAGVRLNRLFPWATMEAYPKQESRQL